MQTTERGSGRRLQERSELVRHVHLHEVCAGQCAYGPVRPGLQFLIEWRECGGLRVVAIDVDLAADPVDFPCEIYGMGGAGSELRHALSRHEVSDLLAHLAERLHGRWSRQPFLTGRSRVRS